MRALHKHTVSCIATLYGQALVPASLAAVQISAGVYNVCAVTTSGTVVCRGSQRVINAVLFDLADVAEVSVGLLFACARLTSRAVRCWGDSRYLGPTPPPGVIITQLSSGFHLNCALEPSGALVCWGSNEFRQLMAPSRPTVRILPTATFQFPASVAAGGAIAVSLSDAQVVGGPANLIFTYAFDCGDGSGFGAASASNTATCPTSASGTQTVQGKVIDAANDFSVCSFSVEVSQSAQAVAFTSSPPTPAYVGSTYLSTAAGGASANPVTFSSLTPATCSATNGTISFIAAGECTVAANQAGSTACLPAPEVTQSAIVIRRSQVITITSLLPLSALVGTELTLSATGDGSGNPVIFTSQTAATCTVSGSSLTLVAAGRCTFVATQGGNATYQPAAPVERSTLGTLGTLTALGELRASVAGAAISTMLRTPLLEKLDAASQAIDTGNQKVACHSLAQFANQVKPKSDKGIPMALADSWLSLLSCRARPIADTSPRRRVTPRTRNHWTGAPAGSALPSKHRQLIFLLRTARQRKNLSHRQERTHKVR